MNIGEIALEGHSILFMKRVDGLSEEEINIEEALGWLKKTMLKSFIAGKIPEDSMDYLIKVRDYFLTNPEWFQQRSRNPDKVEAKDEISANVDAFRAYYTIIAYLETI